MKKKLFVSLFWVLFAMAVFNPEPSSALTSPGSGFVKTFGKSGSLVFEIQERTGHPFYYWPRTLLGYPVRFEGISVTPQQLSLTDAQTGEPVPFQLSDIQTKDGALTFACVHFFSDLPSGGSRRFHLATRPPASGT